MDFRKPRDETAEISRLLAQTSSVSTEAFGTLRAEGAKHTAARSTNGRQLLHQEYYQILQQSKLPSTLTEKTDKGRFGRFFDFGEYVFDVQRSKPEFRKLSKQICVGDSLPG